MHFISFAVKFVIKTIATVYKLNIFFIKLWKFMFLKVDFFKHFYKYACKFLLRKITKFMRRRLKRSMHSFNLLFLKINPAVKKKKRLTLKKSTKLRYFTKNQLLTMHNFNWLNFSTHKSVKISYSKWLFHRNITFINATYFYFQPILRFYDVLTTQKSIKRPVNVVNYLKLKLFSYFKTGNLASWFFLLRLLPINYLFNCIAFKPFNTLLYHKVHLKQVNELIYNNTYSYLSLSISKLTSFSNTTNDTSNSSYFYMKYLLAYIESTFNIKTCISFYAYSSFKFLIVDVQQLLNFYVFPVLRRFNHKFFVNDFVCVLAIMFVQRNCLIFVRWLVRFMEKIHIRLHKKFFFLLQLYFKRIYSLNSSYLNYKGFKLVVKGKISSAGNSKKKIFKFSHGSCSLTKKNHKINYCHKIIRTYTGALGLKVFLFY